MRNINSLDTIAATLSYAFGIDAPSCAASPNVDLCKYIDEKLGGEKVDRIFMYNPDAIAQWLYEKYERTFTMAKTATEIEIPLSSVMPPVTPVCFGTMYTGAQPQVHGIQSYTKPVIAIDTLFDALIRCGKKPAIVSTAGDSLSKIYLEREMDYYICDSIEKVNARAAELIIADKHDFILVYNGNYDTHMHKFGPESMESLAELRTNVRTFGMFCELIEENWKQHNRLVGFAMDHGCHEIDGGCGSHGLDMDEDMNITHLYKAAKGER